MRELMVGVWWVWFCLVFLFPKLIIDLIIWPRVTNLTQDCTTSPPHPTPHQYMHQIKNWFP
jgi:hypothetical protein